jgi:hypothetical protein
MARETEPLEVHQLDAVDVFRDIARIHESQRGALALGTICNVSVGNYSRYLSIRGLPNDMLTYRKLSVQDPKFILLDDVARGHLRIELHSRHRFKIEPANWCGKIKWACSASDPTARVSTLIAAWSLALAVISLLLGILSIYLALK